MFIAENGLKVLYFNLKGIEFGSQIIDFQTRKGSQSHIQDSFGLNFINFEACHKALLCTFSILCFPDDCDGIINCIHSLD